MSKKNSRLRRSLSAPKLFQRIGIPRRLSSSGSLTSLSSSKNNVSVAERSVLDLSGIPLFNVPLRYSYDHHNSLGLERHHEPRLSSLQKKQVSFGESVTVVPVPMRGDYSESLKHKLWSGNLETHETVERNLAEYAAEDYNWRNACLKEDMYICGNTGELIHPVHIEIGNYITS